MAEKTISILDKVRRADEELSNREVAQNMFDRLTKEIEGEISMLPLRDKANLWLQMAKMLTPSTPAEDQRQVSKGAGQNEKIEKLYKKAQ